MLIEREPRLEWIGLASLTAGLQSRRLQEHGVRRLVASIQERGFLPHFPVVVSTMDEGYRLLAGHHRVEAARRVPCQTVPALIYTDLTTDEEWHLSVVTNRAHEAATLPTFVDDAELVWQLKANGKTLEQVASIMGWKSFQQAGRYALLEKITPEGWQLISQTFERPECDPQVGAYEEISQGYESIPSPFNPALLADIVHLLPAQQIELIKLLIKEPEAKNAYRSKADRYRARNQMMEEARHRLRALPPESLARALDEIDRGHLDKEWQEQKLPGPKFLRVMQQYLDEFAQKQNYRLYGGDCYDIALTLEPASVDVILSDPPYSGEELESYTKLAAVVGHLLKPGGSLVIMCGQYHFLEVARLLTKALKPHSMQYYWMLAYMMPGAHATQVWKREVNTFWKPVLWFVRQPYTAGKWIGDVAKSPMHGDDKRFHRWGQSESGMADLLERVSQVGDMVCDPLMGAGTTGVAALRLGRKFIGIELDPESVKTAELRLAEAATHPASHGGKQGK